MHSIATIVGMMLVAASASEVQGASLQEPARPESLHGVPLVPPTGQLPTTNDSAVKPCSATSPALPPAPAPPTVATAPRGESLTLGIGNHTARGPREKPTGISAMVTMGSSLAVVLGLFFLVAWGFRKAAPRGSIVLPGEVFEVLGRAPLGARQQVQLLRCGSKLLLVSITPAGAETLTEVTEPVEVDRLAGLCRQSHPQSATAAFRQVFQQFAPRSGRMREDDDA